MRCKALQEERRHLTRTNISLHKHVSTMMANKSVTVSDKQATILMKEVESLGSMLADNTAEKLLWEEQMKAVKSRKNMRWHPSIIRCCIAIQSKSASAYRVLREAGFIRLPHESTLKKYTQYTDAKVGIQHDALETLLGQIDQTKPQNTKITLILDEMKVKSGLVYSSASGQLIDFTDVGELNNELRDFHRKVERVEENKVEEQLASHAFTIMARGIFENYQQPIAFFPTCALNHSDIYETVWHTVSVVESRGLQVRAIVADGALPNRKFFKQSTSSESEVPYWTWNPVDPTRKIFFFCDVPHLMNTTRNNLENSGFGRKTRNLRVRSSQIFFISKFMLVLGGMH